jgi:flagellar motor switch protein FliG
MNYFNYLEDVTAKDLFEALQAEQLQTIAIVLLQIDRNLAADVLDMFSDDRKTQLAIKMTQIDSLPEVVVKNIANILKTKIQPSGVKLGGIKAVAEILKHFKD